VLRTVEKDIMNSQEECQIPAACRVRDINVTLWLGSFFVACFLTYMLR